MSNFCSILPDAGAFSYGSPHPAIVKVSPFLKLKWSVMCGRQIGDARPSVKLTGFLNLRIDISKSALECFTKSILLI